MGPRLLLSHCKKRKEKKRKEKGRCKKIKVIEDPSPPFGGDG
jgi:hypothetical protein